MAIRKRAKQEDAAAPVAGSNEPCTEDGQQQEARRKSARIRQVRAAPPVAAAPAPVPASASGSSSQRQLSRAVERSLASRDARFIIGVDEAGRGPLAGPVVAAACYVPPDVEVEGIYDSKAVQEEDRERIYEALTSNPKVLYAWARVEPEEIEEINILQAAMLAMKRSVTELVTKHRLKADECYALVDGPYLPDLPVEGKPVVKGDSRVYSIAAASIIAKVERDRIMTEYDKEYPGYGLAQHKGYPTAAHVAAVLRLGPSRIHRLTFRPISGQFPDAMATIRGNRPQPEDEEQAEAKDNQEEVRKPAAKATTKRSRSKKESHPLTKSAKSARKEGAAQTAATTQRPKRAAAAPRRAK